MDRQACIEFSKAIATEAVPFLMGVTGVTGWSWCPPYDVTNINLNPCYFERELTVNEKRILKEDVFSLLQCRVGLGDRAS